MSARIETTAEVDDRREGVLGEERQDPVVEMATTDTNSVDGASADADSREVVRDVFDYLAGEQIVKDGGGG